MKKLALTLLALGMLFALPACDTLGTAGRTTGDAVSDTARATGDAAATAASGIGNAIDATSDAAEEDIEDLD